MHWQNLPARRRGHEMGQKQEQSSGQQLSRRAWLTGVGTIGAGLGLAALARSAAAQNDAEQATLAAVVGKTPVRWVDTIGTVAAPGALRQVNGAFADTV